ncbi:MAG: response regulator, partial [Spirochaetes bacterium]|nr:response regulator [Spirochaetota bacterium]
MNQENTARILIIDDQKIVRRSILDYLEDHGFAVTEAENGRIGLELFKKNKPDLVLVDLRMPEIDGFEVLAGVTKESPETPAIVISGSDEIKDVVKSLHMGAWDYLLKPIQDLSVLLHTVQKNMERARLIRENRQYREYLEAEIDKRTEELRLANEGLRQENYARKKAEEELSKSEKMLDSILGTVPDIIYRIDPDGRIIFINDAVRAYGYTPEELQGKDVLDLVHPDDRDKVKYQINERRTGDRRTKSLEVRLINKEMSSVDFEIRSRGSSEEPVFLIEAEGLYSSEVPKTETFLGTQGIA